MKKYEITVLLSLPVSLSKTIEAENKTEAKKKFLEITQNWVSVPPRDLPDCEAQDYTIRDSDDAYWMINTDE